jgi:fatty acid desaturase
VRTLEGRAIPIPGTLNLAITAGACSAAALLLYAGSHATTWYGMLAAAVAFSFIGNTIFSMLHEAVHNVAHDNRVVNDWIGRVCAAFFPTGFTFQKQCHLSHHRHNRTDHEMFDSYYPNDNKFLKYFQLYCVLSGLYWTNAPTGALLYLVTPGLLNTKILRNRESHVVTHMGADAMITAIFKAPPIKTRLEILFTIAVQAALVYFLGLTFWGWLACYWAFALNWGGLQYADHAWSDRDIRRGAWNLKINRAVQFIFLNYHHHLAHHTYPQVPWLHLHKFVDFSGPRPSFLGIYLNLWKGPRPATQPAPAFIDPELEQLLV